MIKVAIMDDNVAFQYGLMSLLGMRFQREFGKELVFYNKSSFTEIDADILVVSERFGIHQLCCPEICFRRKGMLISIQERMAGCPEHASSGAANMASVCRSDSINDAWRKIKNAWINYSRQGITPPKKCSEGCGRQRLTDREYHIGRLLLKYGCVKKASLELNIDIKTAYAHKYTLKKKFHLRNNLELMYFLQHVNGNEKSHFYCAHDAEREGGQTEIFHRR